MLETRGTLTFADGTSIAGLRIWLDDYVHPWGGSVLVPPEVRVLIADTFRRRLPCELLLEDGQWGMLRVISLGTMTRFEGLGPPVPYTRPA